MFEDLTRLSMDLFLDSFRGATFYFIDFLPETAGKPYNDVDPYLRRHDCPFCFTHRCMCFLLKMLCYYRCSMATKSKRGWSQWVKHSDPDRVVKTVSKLAKKGRGEVYFFFPKIKLLLIFSGDDLYMMVYNLLPQQHGLFEQLVLSEGLFLREGENPLNED